MNIKKLIKRVVVELRIITHKNKTVMMTGEQAKEELNRLYPPKKGVTVLTQFENTQKINYDLSFIVPVYNTRSDLLKSCLESLKNQETKYSYQILLIDDGSAAETVKELNELIKEQENIVLLRQKNGGAGKARNYGLMMAEGRYVSFVDSDDYIEKCFVEKMMTVADQGYDIVKCGYTKIAGNKKSVVVSPEKKYIGDKSFVINYDGFLWAAVYKKSLFETVQLPEKYTFEDMVTRFVFYQLANTFYYKNDALYNYVEYETNTTHGANKSSLNRLDHIYLLETILEDSKLLDIVQDKIEVSLILNELAFMLWYRTKHMEEHLRKCSFLVASNIIQKYIPNNSLNQMSKKEKRLYVSFMKKDYILWDLVSQIWY